jgi:hypothetical protein
VPLTLRQVCFVAEKIQPVIDDLKAVLGLEVCYKDPNVVIFGLENALLPVGMNFIEVVSPVQKKTAAERYLERRRGDGGYMILAQADSLEEHVALRARVEKMGVRIAWETVYETVHFMQLHPADTGGTFFQIDWDTENDHQGHWVPANGKGWKEFVRTGVVSEIRAAELQSPDPETLAGRWSSLADIPLQKDRTGNPEMQLKNAVIRFVKDIDGRGEGLGAIDIKVIDRKKLLKKAEDRQLRISDEQIMICGVRINLI